jgi:hypothetical protein
MKGKFKLQPQTSPDKSLGGSFYAGGDSKVAQESKSKAEGFKKGGKTAKMMGAAAKAHAGRKPRKSGGSVLSAAASGSSRAKSSHY